MSFTMSGVEGGWDFNRFDALSEGKGKEKCDKCKGKGCSHCKGSGYMMADRDDEGEGEGGDGGGAMGEGYMALPTDKMARQSAKAKRKEDAAAEKGDEAETNKQMKRRLAMMDPKGRKQQLMNKEELEVVEEGRKPGESPKEYAKRVTAKFRGSSKKAKEYDPMADPDFDHDKAERTRGSMEEGLDPVGKEDGDVNNNGKKGDSSDKYLLKRRAAIAKAMKKEEAELEMFSEKELDLLEDLLGK